MALPRKLKNLNLFNDGNSYVGVVKSVTLPPLGRKMEAYRAAGMNGPVKVDLGFSDDGIQLEWKLGGLDLVVLKQFGAVNASGIALRFSGAYQQDDTEEVSAVEVTVRGRHETIEMGDAQPGEDTEHSI
ncbi:MAG: phage major tail tube protein, partial [Pseudomonas fluorescens]